MTPGDFWLALRENILVSPSRPVIMDLYTGSAPPPPGKSDPIWNHPVYQYQISCSVYSGSEYSCTAVIGYKLDTGILPGANGFLAQHRKANTYTFRVQLQNRLPVSGTGQWLSTTGEGYPDWAWFPGGPVPTNPYVDPKIVRQLIERPSVTSFALNNGAASTTSRAVTLNNSVTNSPTQYMASESSSFSGAPWQTYSAAPSFTLSSGTGTKTVYFKVKNAVGESPGVSDTITLTERPAVASFAINNGAASTTSRAVTLNNSVTNSPTQYMASESSSFSGAPWQTYSAAPSFTLSSGTGTKTVYFKVKNAVGESPGVSDTITLTERPAVASFAINNGAASTTSRAVTLNNSVTNSPTQYMASESSSFSGAPWQTYSVAPSFTLSSGTGTKTVYFKVKNAVGEYPVSATRSR